LAISGPHFSFQLLAASSALSGGYVTWIKRIMDIPVFSKFLRRVGPIPYTAAAPRDLGG
jgi:hypothetical protein